MTAEKTAIQALTSSEIILLKENKIDTITNPSNDFVLSFKLYPKGIVYKWSFHYLENRNIKNEIILKVTQMCKDNFYQIIPRETFANKMKNILFCFNL